VIVSRRRSSVHKSPLISDILGAGVRASWSTMQLLQGVWDAVAAAMDVDAWWTTHGGFVGAAAGVALAVLHAATAAAARDVADPDHGVTVRGPPPPMDPWTLHALEP